MSVPALNSLEACEEFVKTQSPNTIAERILQDQRICRENNGIPSLLVCCLPSKADDIARAISGKERIPMSVARLRLSSITSLIKSHFAAGITSPEASPDEIPSHMIPSDDDLKATLKVLRYLQLPQIQLCPDPSTPLHKVIEKVHDQLSTRSETRHEANQRKERQKLCYMCRFVAPFPHRLYPSLCPPCGEFNIASLSLSLPDKLNLSNKTALVTGGRINLGYHTALRLLRCGAYVIVSTRYPSDAQKRYLDEQDATSWKNRLRVVGADFRSAKDVFGLVKAVVRCLKDWKPDGKAKLDILINNAAQTLTDSLEKEDENIQQEIRLQQAALADPLLLESSYSPRVRGGVTAYQLEYGSATNPSPVRDEKEPTSALITSRDAKSSSSWSQSISEIPYEDVISAHSVNTFVPFILLRELLPFLSVSPQTTSDPHTESQQLVKPRGYVVNVSSREGLYERRPNHPAKEGHHVHTNMSKAALNMLTETEAGPAWKKGKVAINTVDPGYMSADPVYMEMIGRTDNNCPIGWEDGAGRVLWPIAKGESEETIRGRFLKHFSAINLVR